MGRCRGFILWRGIFGWSEGSRLEWWANRAWPLHLTSFRRCFPWRHTLVGFVYYGAPGLLGLEALQLTCRGLGGPGQSAILLRSEGGVLDEVGLLDEASPLYFFRHATSRFVLRILHSLLVCFAVLLGVP